jgi:hypothetical protein
MCLRILTLLLLVGLAPGCSRDSRPSFVVISLDTTRADQMSLYGYGRPTTPEIDALASTGIVFEQAVTVTNNTLIAHASIFTGLLPVAHGVLPHDEGHAVPPGAVTLAEDFLASGYQTAGFTAHADWLNERYGMARGFETFSSDYRPAEDGSQTPRPFSKRATPIGRSCCFCTCSMCTRMATGVCTTPRKGFVAASLVTTTVLCSSRII